MNGKYKEVLSMDFHDYRETLEITFPFKWVLKHTYTCDIWINIKIVIWNFVQHCQKFSLKIIIDERYKEIITKI